MQLCGYVFFESSKKPFKDEKFKDAYLMFENSTVLAALSSSGFDKITIFFFYLIEIIMFLIMSYIVFLTIIRTY